MVQGQGRRRTLQPVWLLVGVLSLMNPAHGEEILFNFDHGFDFNKVEARDVKVSKAKRPSGSALRMETFHHEDWPGITLKPPADHWDLSRYESIGLDVKNAGTNVVQVGVRIDNPGADGNRNCVQKIFDFQPGEKKTLAIRLVRRVSEEMGLFGMRGYPGGAMEGWQSIDPANVTQMLIFVPKPKEDHRFEIDNIHAYGTYTAPALKDDFFPFIDTYGQYIHKDWPGKTHKAADLARHRKREARDLARHAGPKGWNKYGGWRKGPRLPATGYFYPARHEGKWWLVDPEGKLFFSHGIDCVGAWDGTPVDERENWFQNLPGRDDPNFKGFHYQAGHVVHGHYQGKRPQCFNFSGANVKRKYGDNWKEKFSETSHRRLRSWGMNTIANWSDGNIYLKSKTPYVVAVHFGGPILQGSEGYWQQFRDVFDLDFEQQLRTRMQKEVDKSAGDPWCIGYFVDNEISWGDELSLAVAALTSPPDQKAKQVFIKDLKAKYKTIRKLNKTWGTKHQSWDALLNHREAPDKKAAREDLLAFNAKTAERYFQVCRDAVKEVAPKNLYLGCRFAWVNDQVAKIAMKYCDVVSYNLYWRSMEHFKFPGGADTPLIIGEFHFGALDRGQFHPGLVLVKDQKERARMYREYVRGVLRHPQFVGCHWFKYMDEATTGRELDGENYQIGFLDIVDTPYPETVAASRKVGYNLYAYRLKAK